MIRTSVVAFGTFLALLRDRLFLWIFLALTLLCLIAAGVSDWSVDSGSQIFHDFSLAAIEFCGVATAIIWSTRSLADSSHDGSIEIHLAAPITRSVWYLGKYLGVVITLVAMNLAAILVFGCINLLKEGNFITANQIFQILFLIEYWAIVAALGVFFSSLSSQLIAMFTTIGFWLCGLSTVSIQKILPANADDFTRNLVGFLAKYWDLAQFRNLATWWLQQTDKAQQVEWQLALVAGKGVLLALTLVTAGCLLFERKDLNTIS